MKKILLIEDDQTLADIYARRLGEEGYEVSVIYDGESSLSKALDVMPDLIITGILMPKVSGFDVLDILKSTEQTEDIPVVILSALHQSSDIERARELGATDYLVKSRDTIKVVLDVIKKVLEGKYTQFEWSDSHMEQKSK